MGTSAGSLPAEGATSHVDVLGVRVSAINMSLALETIERWIQTDAREYVCVTGVHGVMESQKDKSLLDIHNSAGMVTPDGMPLVWLSRMMGFHNVERVYGPDLMLACCQRSVGPSYRHFFFGGAEGVPQLLAKRLCTRFHGLNVAGTYSPPFRELSSDEDNRVVERINTEEPDIVWVGLSTPKQERWMASHVKRLNAPVLIGVGAAFDFHAGLKRQAPYWVQRCGLEWAFRLLSEPRRLGPRYLVNNPLFVYKLIRGSLRIRH